MSKSLDMSPTLRVLFVDEDRASARAHSQALEAEGFVLSSAASVSAARRKLALGAAILVVRRELEGVEAWLAEGTPMVLLSSFGSSPATIEGCEELCEPVSPEDLVRAVRRQAQRWALEEENRRLREEVGQRFQLGKVLSRDPALQKIARTVEALSDTKATVLICGESGTGKSLLARTIHQLSARREGPFVEVNCGALPANLLESELFGHAKGSFTGALRDREGKFEAAQGGTIFLDEIGVAAPELQVKLLRVLQERSFERIGESRTRHSDARVIAATNADLENLVRSGQFREDLYWRLHVVTLNLPPLRERPRDILLLSEHFLQHFAHEHQRPAASFSASAQQALVSHHWPGNVRELEHCIERAVLLSDAAILDAQALALADPRSSASQLDGQPSLLPLTLGIPLRQALEQPEREIIRRTLELHGGCRQATAAMLAVNRATLFNKMRKYGLLSFPHRQERTETR